MVSPLRIAEVPNPRPIASMSFSNIAALERDLGSGTNCGVLYLSQEPHSTGQSWTVRVPRALHQSMSS